MNNNNGQGTANIVSPDQDNDWERKPKCDTIISTMRVIQENESTSIVRERLTSKESMKRRSVSFDHTVTVQTIPGIDEYSDNMKKSLWYDTYERIENIDRNKMEFECYENKDWQQVVEEDGFYKINGEMIHPFHVLLHKRRIEEEQSCACPFLRESQQLAYEWRQKHPHFYSGRPW